MRSRVGRAGLIGLLILAVALSLVAGVMSLWIRGAEEVAHATRNPRLWHVDVYACAVVAALACLAWVVFFARAWQRIAANKLPPPRR